MEASLCEKVSYDNGEVIIAVSGESSLQQMTRSDKAYFECAVCS